MSKPDENRKSELNEGNEKWALILILALVLGIPALGILVKLLGE